MDKTTKTYNLLQLSVEVGEDRVLHIKLPDDFPLGKAQVQVSMELKDNETADGSNKIRTGQDLLESEFVGMWADREDITDSVEFARNLRESVWDRQQAIQANVQTEKADE
jgi:hypothetical protein